MKRMLIGVLIGFLTLGGFDSGVAARSIVGLASYYKSGKKTANGESFNPNGMTAGPTAPCPLGQKFW